MKIYTTIFLCLLFSSASIAQDIIHPASATANFAINGSHNYYDSGGVACNGDGGGYANSTNGTAILCPSVSSSPVTIEFLEVDIETRNNPICWDYLTIYDGNSTAAPVLFTGCGEEGFQDCSTLAGDGSDGGDSEGGPNDINASASGMPANVNNIWTSSDASGCLTVQFTSDASVPQGGWVALVTSQVASVPTLGQWGIIILCLFFLVFGVIYIKNYARSTKEQLS